MRKIFFIAIIIFIWTISSNIVVYGEGKIAKKSSGVQFGVRQYFGALPPEIKYTSLGQVKAQGQGGMTVEILNTGLMYLTAEAKKLGANAVINVNFEGSIFTGEAIIAETFPDEYTEEDFKDFKGLKEYSFSEVFEHDFIDVFNVIQKILSRELYDIAVADVDKGIIETKLIEVSCEKREFFSASEAPYPVMKLSIKLEEPSKGKTRVTENYIFLKGRMWSDTTIKKSNSIFFKDIKKELE